MTGTTTCDDTDLLRFAPQQLKQEHEDQ